MEIIYMKEIQKNIKIDRKKHMNEGFNENEIKNLETIFNKRKEFPIAFREFLFLAGKYNNFAFDDLGEGLNELQNIAKEELQMTRQKVDRPFFAFDVYDSQYSVIFLDETEEDPKVYIINPYGAKEGSEPLIKPNGWIFSELVNENIRRVKNNIAF